MLSIVIDQGFRHWRDTARALYLAGVAPADISWQDPGSEDLFAAPQNLIGPAQAGRSLQIPAKLLAMLESAAQFRCPQRWALLYQILWRVGEGDRAAFLAGDPAGSELALRLKAIRREIHHMHAFLRFIPPARQPWDLVAWFEPEHDILLSASQHFIDRLGQLRWLIATPTDAVSFDGTQLSYQAHCPPAWQTLAQAHISAEQGLWQTYYQSIFNPARLNENLLSQQMPKRFWKHLPEGTLIPVLTSQARSGAQRDGQALAVAQKMGKQIIKPGT